MTTTMPSTKTGLRKIAAEDLATFVRDNNIAVAEGATKPVLIDAILVHLATPETETVVEESKPEEPAAEEETEMEIEATPKSLATLPTWIYFIDASTRAASTSIKRAYGDACAVVERKPTVQDFNRFAQNLKATGHATVVGSVDGETETVSVYRARAI